jgi:hypothetical protein
VYTQFLVRVGNVKVRKIIPFKGTRLLSEDKAELWGKILNNYGPF